MSRIQFIIKRVRGLTKLHRKDMHQVRADFPGWGRVPQRGRPNFPENCMNMKTLDQEGEGARPKFYYVDLALHVVLR